MRRKLVKQGPSTLTVSIPSQWVHTNNLHPGQEVQLQILRNKLIIQTDEPEKKEKSITLDIREYSPRTMTLLLHATHKCGFEQMEVRCTREQTAQIEEIITKKLLGFEIVEQREETILIRFVTRTEPAELPMLIRRIFLVTLSLAEAVAKGQEKEEISVLEATNNRLVNYTQRIIMQMLYEKRELLFAYIIVWLLEKIADEYKNAQKIKQEEAQRLHEILKEFYELYYSYSIKKHDAWISAVEDQDGTFTENASRQILSLFKQFGASAIAVHLESETHSL